APAPPDTDGDGLPDVMEINITGTNPNDPDTDGDGMWDGDEAILGTDPRTPDSACAELSMQASRVSRPMDVIFAIDSSGSMTGEISQVENNINIEFATIIGASQIDYRIIMVAAHSHGNKNKIRICAPVSGDDCTGSKPDAPINTATYFHYDWLVDSHDAFNVLLNRYDQADDHGLAPNGWGAWLRPDAFKTFIIISDDKPTESGGNVNTAPEFDAAILAKSPQQFGSASSRNYIWHSIVGLVEKTTPPPSDPWLPTDPVQTQRCSPGSVDEAVDYQELSILTGGLRFPQCDNESFAVVFNAIADGVVTGAGLPCTYAIPPPAGGETIDTSRVVLRYTPSGGSSYLLDNVRSAGSCAANGYYIDSGMTIHLCPSTCAVLEADDLGTLTVHAACTDPPV
ncbi:MAG: hypothetical protein V3T05_13220, partial [Myxococcota bacterium]